MSAPPPSGDYAAATTTTTTFSLQPWSDFLSLSSLSLPVSLSDATTRLNQNLTHFKPNYIIFSLLIFSLSLLFSHPLSLLFLAAIIALWFFLYLSRPNETPLEILGFEIDDRIIIGVLGLITFVAMILMNVWGSLIIAGIISAVLICLHGVLRVPSNGLDDPYGGLLDAQDGAYSEF